MMICCILAFCLCATHGIAQNRTENHGTRPVPQLPQLPPQLMPPHPPGKMQQRYFDIDAKRQIENIESEDALPRSREFKRIDSTYYVGWMYEGVYKYNHAADFLGYKNAAIPLERALALMEHDYSKALATRTDQPLVLYPIKMLFPDYTMIAYYLMTCYSNTDQPDKVFQLLQRMKKWKFQASYYMDTYNYMAWTVHRNRFYTSAKYSFLKNSIDENERLANRYLDTALIVIAKNKALNVGLEPVFPYMRGNEEREKLSVYFYKAMLCSYDFNIDSAKYYYELQRKANRLPHNNFANFLGVIGEFRTQEAEYDLASRLESGDKRLQEWAYYSSILDIYKAKPKAGVLLAKNMVKAAGSTPGYGWYNIALSRAMLYDGQISESQRYADKAAEFKELHIGTTLGQGHYDFSIQLLKLIHKEQSWQMEQFEHSNWWYNPNVLLSMAKKLGEKYLQQFLIINQFAQNPERDRVIYKLFSTESTVSWDEIWYLIHDFSTGYFVRNFEKSAVNDNRESIRKYFALFVARLKIQQGKHTDAKRILDKILKDPNIDEDYERLFLARVYQAEAECAREQKNIAAQNDWLYRMYILYPQLVPYTGMPANMVLHISGDVDKAVEQRLRSCSINWVTNSSIPAVNAYVIFSRNGKRKDITYYVLDKAGNYIVNKQAFAWQKAEETGTALAYRLFNIGGKEDEDEVKK
ncbi:MAG: hypothetical protein JWQ38_1326 [Flavipsychrobacter sp.]|nr:hypothetical protein [Flavipsychrobacter sp.]